jgi:hypothetical protein
MTTARRIPISHFDDESERCKASNQPDLLNASFRFIQRYTTHSMFITRKWVAPKCAWKAGPGMNVKKPLVRKLRCAVYTRQSSEEGLEQEFKDAVHLTGPKSYAEGWPSLRYRASSRHRPGQRHARRRWLAPLPALPVLFSNFKVDIALSRRADLILVYSPDATGITLSPRYGLLPTAVPVAPQSPGHRRQC